MLNITMTPTRVMMMWMMKRKMNRYYVLRIIQHYYWDDCQSSDDFDDVYRCEKIFLHLYEIVMRFPLNLKVSGLKKNFFFSFQSRRTKSCVNKIKNNGYERGWILWRPAKSSTTSAACPSKATSQQRKPWIWQGKSNQKLKHQILKGISFEPEMSKI